MRLTLVLALVALSLAGCGVLDDVGPATQATPDPSIYGPAEATDNDSPTSSELPAPPKVAPSREVAAELDAGRIGIVDIVGTVGVEPAGLDTASDLTVTELHWSHWDASGASGEGVLRVPTCQPTCATGLMQEIPARVELSAVKTCGDRRYFDHAEVRVDPGQAPSGMQPASYVRAPC
jgi:hypothetical protein